MKITMKKITKLIPIGLAALVMFLLILSSRSEKEGTDMKTHMMGEKNMIGKGVPLTSVTLTTIYDNYEHAPELRTGWGFSCLVRADGNNILFDTGGDSETLLHNMKKLGIETKEINMIVLSHIHSDHVGGLFGLLEENAKNAGGVENANNNITVYLPKSFPRDFKEKIKSYGANVVEVSSATKISDGVYTTGELGTWIKEQSLIIRTGKGLVIVTGCSHPGIVNIIKRAKELTNEIVYLVIGGFHLSASSDQELEGIIKSFRELGVEKAAPCHCSGNRTRALFHEEYADDFIENGVGKTIKI